MTPVTGVPELAVRVYKTRREGWCNRCNKRVRRLEQVAISGGQFMHATCLVKAILKAKETG